MSDRLIQLLWGPNFDQLGVREPDIYGKETLEDHVHAARALAGSYGFGLESLQSASEAELIAAIHRARHRVAAIVINPGAFTHYAWGIHDALASFDGKVVEWHFSNPQRRESWRHTSVVSPVADATLIGFGANGCLMAVEGVITLCG